VYKGVEKGKPKHLCLYLYIFSNFGGEISFSFATEYERLVKKRELKGFKFEKSSKLSFKATYLTNLSLSRKL